MITLVFVIYCLRIYFVTIYPKKSCLKITAKTQNSVSRIIMSNKCITAKNITFTSWINNISHSKKSASSNVAQRNKIDLLLPLRNWLNNLKISDRNLAHKICEMIPTQCPFARTIKLFNHEVLTIPPLCKLNPLYNEVVALRFRALCYLADECGEDISSYC